MNYLVRKRSVRTRLARSQRKQGQRRRERGTTSVEYLIVLSVAVLAAVALLILLGPDLLERYALFRTWMLLPVP